MKNSQTGLLTAIDSCRAGSGAARTWLGRLVGGRDDDRVLERTGAALRSRQKEMAFLSEVGQLFQACRSIEEVCKVAGDRLQTLSPELSGALYLTRTSDAYLENVMTWGTIGASDMFFAPGDCWALRCGRPHQVTRGHDPLACAHAEMNHGEWHLCLPLMAQGEALGILYFRADAASSRRSRTPRMTQDRLHFFLNVSETLSLAVANIRLRESLQQQAIRDPLTGLFNRRYFEETLRRELHRAGRAEQPLSLVILDIDHFKRFNDSFGHDAGDAALRAVGEILRGRTRAGDVACRYGGEEFALTFPGMPTEVAMARVEALRSEVETREIHFLGQTLDPVTISAGTAVYPNHAVDMESLIRAADQALYQSKQAGRNQGTLAIAPRRRTDAAPLSLVRIAAEPDKAAAGSE